MFPLFFPDSVQHMVQAVFFSREADKLPCGDSSIRCHDAAYRIGIDPQVYRTDLPVPCRFLRQAHLLLKRKLKEVFPVPFYQDR
jgi:hypothetical protein